MDTSQARDHIEMVDNILARSERSLKVGGEFFLVWGVFGAAVNLVGQLVLEHRLPATSLWALPVLLAAAIVFSAVRGRQLRQSKGGLSLIQSDFFAVLWITLGAAAFVDLTGFKVFSNWAASAIWSVCGAIVLFYIASHGNRRALTGGLILIVSLAAANFWPAFIGYILGAGMLLGYAGFGLASLNSRD